MNSSGSSRLSSQPLFFRVNPGQVRQRLKTKSRTKSQSSFLGPPSRKLILTIPQAQHQLSSSNHSALSVYPYCDLLTNNLIKNNAKEWPTIKTIRYKTPEGTIFQGHNVQLMILSLDHFHSYRGTVEIWLYCSNQFFVYTTNIFISF